MSQLYEEICRIRKHNWERRAQEERPDEATVPQPLFMVFPESTVQEEPQVAQLRVQNFSDNVNILATLQDMYEFAEIGAYFPPLPKLSAKNKNTPVTEELQHITKQCIKLLNDEYMMVARLLVAQTPLEKKTLLIDYMMSDEGVDFIERKVSTLSDLQRETYLFGISEGLLDHYTYVVAGINLLADKIRDVCARQDMDSMDRINHMLSYLDAARKIIQSRDKYLTGGPLPVKNEHTAKLLPIRFNIIRERLKNIRGSLVAYQTKVLPSYQSEILRSFQPKEMGGKKKGRLGRQAQKPRASSLIKKREPAAPSITPVSISPLPPELAIVPAARPTPIVPLSQEVLLENTVRVDTEVTPAALSAPQSSLFAVPGPAPAPSNAEHKLMASDNPCVASLSKHNRAIYEQIFFGSWKDKQHLALSDVEKLIKQLGGQIRGAGGSRTKIIFDNRSVATIEHRHGRDRAKSLYKLSVSLLQRGLGIAGFAPLDWKDELSRARDMIIEFKNYAAERMREQKKAQGSSLH